jgi:hypothetical protein
VTIIGAILAATLFAGFARPFSDYHYWFSWRRSAFATGVVLYFLVAGVGAGLLGWVIGTVSKSVPTAWPLLNGALFGLVGALTVRAELGQPPPISTKSRGRVTSDPAASLTPAFTLLGVATNWTFDMTDQLVGRSVDRWILALTDGSLRSVGHQLVVRVKQLDNVPDSAKVRIYKELVPTIEALKQVAGEDSDGPRAQLRGFAAGLIREHRWTLPL